MDQEELREIPARIQEAVEQFIHGKDDLLRLLIVGLLAGGHILVEGLPGTAKTLTSRLFAQTIGGSFKRIQLTPDMLPGDITGFNLYRLDGSQEFIEGPLFANIVMADELNRTTPRTQSAFLEAMAETQVTVEGTTYTLPHPFMVIGSQLPYGGEGTFPLAEVQADRFQYHLWSGYPERQIEAQIIGDADILEEPQLQAVTDPEALLKLRELVKNVHVSGLVVDYILDLVGRLRSDSDVLRGPSPRASLALYRGSRAMALLEGRDYVIPDDVRALAMSVFEHRVRPTAEAELDEVTSRSVVERAVETVAVPKGALMPEG